MNNYRDITMMTIFYIAYNVYTSLMLSCSLLLLSPIILLTKYFINFSLCYENIHIGMEMTDVGNLLLGGESSFLFCEG